MTNVVEFKSKEESTVSAKEQRVKEIYGKYLEDYANSIDTPMEELVLDFDGLVEKIRELKEDNVELVFRSAQEAILFGEMLLSLPENENVSHYNITSGISRKSLFVSLVPVLKSKTLYAFPEQDTMNQVFMNAFMNDASKLAEEEMGQGEE